MDNPLRIFFFNGRAELLFKVRQKKDSVAGDKNEQRQSVHARLAREDLNTFGSQEAAVVTWWLIRNLTTD